MVLATIMIVVVLANVILVIISNQSRLTRHEVGRVQAYYAAQAGIVYALEKLRLGSISGTTNGGWTYTPVNSCPNSTPCPVPDAGGDAGFAPYVVGRIAQVIFCAPSSSCSVGTSTVSCNPPAGIDFCVQSFVNYTYSP